jgi:hypothetical protein
MIAGPVHVQVPERVNLLLIRRPVACGRNCDLKTALQGSEGRNIYCNTSQFGENYRGQSFIAAVIQIPDVPPV